MKPVTLIPYTLLLASGLVASNLQAADAEQLQRGEYLARAGDCVACHTAPGGEDFAGGLPMASPIGEIYSTNITPDPQTGIGHYTLEDFSRALREGKTRNGDHLYPAMPYPSYAKITDEDMAALYTYFMEGVAPVVQDNQETDIPWPLNMRWPLAIWKGLFLEDDLYQPDSKQSEQWNRGAYLVQGPGHCGACHTPRGVAFQEQALDNSDDRFLSGAELEGWWASNLRGDWETGIGSLSVQELVRLLKTGSGGHLSTSGSMSDVITHSTAHLNDSDLTAIAVYLKSLGMQRDSVSTAVKEPVTNGAELYNEYCSTCHRDNGAGYPGATPALAANPTVVARSPNSVINVILHGVESPATPSDHIRYQMPAYAWQLNDTQVAALVNHLRTRWGNQASTIQEKDIEALRH